MPYTVQEHDCRGIIAATAVCVHAVGPRTTRAAVATGVIRCKAACSCARTRIAGFRWSSAVIATAATSTAPIVRPMRVAGRCIELGDDTRQAAVAGSNMRSGRAVTEDAKIK